MALQSPGVQVSVIDESFYTPGAAGTVPVIFVATAGNKVNGSQTGIADGTLESNAGRPYLITSQRELVERFGEPLFYSDSSGNMIHGSELNEYGLQTAYSALGVSNRAYVVRASIDLAKLAPSATPPGGQPQNGTYWFNSAVTIFGMLEWNGSASLSAGGQSFSAITPIVITQLSDTVGVEPFAPRNNVGTTGDYAVVTVSNIIRAWYRNNKGIWVEVGSGAWKASWPAAVGTRAVSALTTGQTMVINGTTVTLTGTTMTDLATSINDATIPGVTAEATTNTISIFTESDSLVLAAGLSGSLLENAGLLAKTYYAPSLAIDPHTIVPRFKTNDAAPRPTGSVWLKTTEPNGGAKFRVNRYNADTQLWETVFAPVYKSNQEAIYTLDKTGGTRLSVGDLYVRVNVDETAQQEANYTIFRRAASGETITTSARVAGQISVASGSFDIQETRDNLATLSDVVTISVSGLTESESDAQTIAAAINSTPNLRHVVASVNSTNRVVIRHKLGGDIRIKDTNGILSAIGINDQTAENVYAAPVGDATSDYLVSLWAPLVYEVSNTAPLTLTNDGEIWYNSIVDEVDIMVKQGDNWVGYRNVYNLTRETGPFVSASEPTAEVVDGDLWIDTADLDNYPTIYRYNSSLSRWILVDKTDQTTENGIIFADVRWSTSGQDSEPATIQELLENNYVDPDAPDPALYPEGMLLWNLRRSGFNVKKFVRNYINTAQLNNRFGNESTAAYYPHRWVTESGNNVDGSGTFGRYAQRKVVVQALQATVNSGQEIRDEEARQFNLISCPGYPELIGEMITLNYDRRLTAFVVGDSPMRLKPDATSLNEWGANVRRAVEDNDDGLVSFDEYLGVYYGAGFTSSNAGKNIVMPPSYMALRTLIVNDQVAYPWFAPAGTRRGGVTNATASGYISAEGEFVSVALNTGQRDTLYTNNINPITFLNGSGLVVYGQKTRARNASALDRVNVARLIVYMRGQLERLTRSYLFEPNDQITREQIKSAVEGFCLELVGLRGIYDYLVVCDESNNTPPRVDRNELYVDVAIEPVKAIEFIYIPLRIKNTGEISNLG
jgi:hypothetical protein